MLGEGLSHDVEIHKQRPISLKFAEVPYQSAPLTIDCPSNEVENLNLNLIPYRPLSKMVANHKMY